MNPEVFLLVGTRPEAIKIAPVALALRNKGRLRPVLISSAQHNGEIIDQALRAFDLKAELVLPIERTTGTPTELCSQIMAELDGVISERNPAALLVQGDTTTTMAGALTAFYRQVPVVHLEAGLRSFDLTSPFPEEGNRRIVSQVSALHLAPTQKSAQHLRNERTVGTILSIGNTVVDAITHVAARRLPYSVNILGEIEELVLAGHRRLVMVTAHRRESWGEPLNRILRAVRQIVLTNLDVEVVLPAHPNPDVQRQVKEVIGSLQRVTITNPLPYSDLARLLSISTLVLSDSGGIQEEAPSFGVPVLVLRDVTERQEAVDVGCATLVGTNLNLIVQTATSLLTDEKARSAMITVGNPFGDGRAAQRTEQALAWLLGLTAIEPTEFLH